MKKAKRLFRTALLLFMCLYPFIPASCGSVSAPFSGQIREDGTAVLLSLTENVKTVTIPELLDGAPVTVVESGCFSSMADLKTVLVPTGVSFRKGAFSNCENLSRIIFLSDIADDTDVGFIENCPGAVLFIQKDCTSLIALAWELGLSYDIFDVLYVGNAKTKKLHLSDCSSVTDMSEKNKTFFFDRDEAVGSGYVPCKRCTP